MEKSKRHINSSKKIAPPPLKFPFSWLIVGVINRAATVSGHLNVKRKYFISYFPFVNNKMRILIDITSFQDNLNTIYGLLLNYKSSSRILTFLGVHSFQHLIEDVERPLVRILVGYSCFLKKVTFNVSTVNSSVSWYECIYQAIVALYLHMLLQGISNFRVGRQFYLSQWQWHER